jgi:hypothetical protein
MDIAGATPRMRSAKHRAGKAAAADPHARASDAPEFECWRKCDKCRLWRKVGSCMP